MKQVVYSRTAINPLRKYANRAAIIREKISHYATDSNAQANIRALTGSPYLRLRVGDFRVIFAEDATTITVLDIGPRGGIYQ